MDFSIKPEKFSAVIMNLKEMMMTAVALGSILRNSISAETFSDKFTLEFRTNFSKKIADKYVCILIILD
jgi:hypothetical protein